MVTIKPLPIPKTTRATTIRAYDSNLAARAVRREPRIIMKLMARVPQTEPNISINIPPAIGKIVLMIETEAEMIPYWVLEMARLDVICFFMAERALAEK